MSCLIVTSPEVETPYGLYWFEGCRALDPSLRSSRAQAVGLRVMHCQPGEHRQQDLAASRVYSHDLYEAWYRPMVDFLHHDDAEAHAAEIKVEAGDIFDTITFHFQVRQRRDDRLFGIPQFGDLCVSLDGAYINTNTSSDRAYVFQHIDPCPVGHHTTMEAFMPDGQRVKVGLICLAQSYPNLLRLTPASLGQLAKGGLSHHQKTKLLAYQKNVCAARERGELSLNMMADFWEGRHGPYGATSD